MQSATLKSQTELNTIGMRRCMGDCSQLLAQIIAFPGLGSFWQFRIMFYVFVKQHWIKKICESLPEHYQWILQIKNQPRKVDTQIGVKHLAYNPLNQGPPTPVCGLVPVPGLPGTRLCKQGKPHPRIHGMQAADEITLLPQSAENPLFTEPGWDHCTKYMNSTAIGHLTNITVVNHRK